MIAKGHVYLNHGYYHRTESAEIWQEGYLCRCGHISKAIRGGGSVFKNPVGWRGVRGREGH